MSYKDFIDSEIALTAVERKFEIIGEAVNRLSHETSDIDNHISSYHRIIGLRNVIAHGYDLIDYELLWDVVANYLPNLIEEIDIWIDN